MHTLTPWIADECYVIALEEDEVRGETICECIPFSGRQYEQKANAEFIVRAVNSHYQLVAALKDALKMIEDEVSDGHYTDQAHMARVALAAAGEQS